MNTALLPRPFSYDHPRNARYHPLVHGKVERVNRRRRLAWRSTVSVDDCPMAFGHFDTKEAAEAHTEKMIRAYAEVHYWQS